MILEIQESDKRWLQFTTAPDLQIDAEAMEKLITDLRSLLPDREIKIESNSLYFETGQALYDWLAEVRTELNSDWTRQGLA